MAHLTHQYLHPFDTDAEFEAAYSGENYKEPWVSYTIENEEVNYNRETPPGPTPEPGIEFTAHFRFWDNVSGISEVGQYTFNIEEGDMCDDGMGNPFVPVPWDFTAMYNYGEEWDVLGHAKFPLSTRNSSSHNGEPMIVCGGKLAFQYDGNGGDVYLCSQVADGYYYNAENGEIMPEPSL